MTNGLPHLQQLCLIAGEREGEGESVCVRVRKETKNQFTNLDDNGANSIIHNLILPILT